MTFSADSHAALRPPAWADELDRLDAAVYAAIAATSTPAMDVALRRLSRTANHSRLWLGCFALLAACGGERGQRGQSGRLPAAPGAADHDGLAGTAVSDTGRLDVVVFISVRWR
jgi:undecaprenyl-diphosphatase